jgi:hypothetical protein
MGMHETQKVREPVPAEAQSTFPMLEGAQRIEGGGPPQRVVLSQLPKPIRFIGYGIYGAAFLMLAAFIVVYVLK